jgi:hypothetical protein
MLLSIIVSAALAWVLLSGFGLQPWLSALGIVADALPSLIMLWAAAAGMGQLVFRLGLMSRDAMPWSIRCAIGLMALGLLLYTLAWTVALHRSMVMSVLAVGWIMLIAEGFRKLRRAGRGESHPTLRSIRQSLSSMNALWFSLPGAALLVMAACCPPGTIWRVEAMGYDVMSYHLQVPREWVAAGRMLGLEHNVYSFLPGMMELFYAVLITLRGGEAIGSLYACQLFSVSLMGLAAAGVGCAVLAVMRRDTSGGDPRIRKASSAASGVIGGIVAGVFLCVPWVLVTGSMAYHEAGMLAFGIAALTVALQGGLGVRHAAVVGLLLGMATLCKPTAGFMLGLPIGVLILLLAWRNAPSEKRVGVTLRVAAVCLAVGLLTLSPYLARNAAATGNPLFPFALDLLGQGHWSDATAERWQLAHGEAPRKLAAVTAIWQQVLGNTGYGAIGGSPTPAESYNIARFANQGGLPVLWITVAIASGLGLFSTPVFKHQKLLVLAMLGWIAWQVLCWLGLTHRQSRFMITLLPPAVVLLGIGLGTLAHFGRPAKAVALGCGGLVIVALLWVSFLTLQNQTTPLRDAAGNPLGPAPLGLIVDALPTPHGTGLLPEPIVNQRPIGSPVLIVADNSSLLYAEAPFHYASAFDEPWLADAIQRAEQTNTPSRSLAIELRERGIRYVYVGYGELSRLHATYGFDPRITEASLRTLTVDWPREFESRVAGFYRVPQN